MDFSFTSEQHLFRESMSKFCEDNVAPYYSQREKDGVIDKELCLEMGELGMIGCELPEKFGGMGMDRIRWTVGGRWKTSTMQTIVGC